MLPRLKLQFPVLSPVAFFLYKKSANRKIDRSQHSEGVRSSSSDMFQIFVHIFGENIIFRDHDKIFGTFSGFSGFRENFREIFCKK